MSRTDERFTPLDSFVDSRAPICYGILKPGNHYPGGIPVIKVKNIIDGRVLEDEILLTSPEIHAQYKRAEVRTGDLLLTIRGSTGRVAAVPQTLNGANITQDTARIRVSSDDYVDYVYYALQAPSVQRQIELNTVGQAVKGINIAEVRKLKILHPTLPEQRKIAAVLSTWDNAIAITERLLANSEKQKKALMQQLLTGKKRLPGFSSEWTEGHIRDVAKVSKGKALGSKDLSPGSYPVIAGGKTSPYTHSAFTNENVITISASGAYAGFASFHPYKIWASDCSVITSNKSSSIKFLYFYFVHHQSKLYSLQNGGAQPHVYPKDIENLPIRYPCHDEQESIASVIASAEKEIDILRTSLERLRDEKKALMQQLLTGKRRVKVEAPQKEVTYG